MPPEKDDQMPGALNLKDIMKLLELNKSRAELVFRIGLQQDDDSAEVKSRETRLHFMQHELNTLLEHITSAGVIVPLPKERELSRLNESLSSYTTRDLADAMKKGTGPVYALLAERGALLKQNFMNRENIAKLALLLSRLQKDVREAVAGAVRNGKIDTPIPIIEGEKALGMKVASILGRLGMPSEVRDGALVPAERQHEIFVQLPNRRVWVTPEVHGKLSVNLQKFSELAPKIQHRNAVRQVKVFNEEEEKEFNALQNEYLMLLKEQDELLKEFEEESGLSISV